MAKFTVCIRAIKHLTREITVNAQDEGDARQRAIWMANAINWDESEPEDIQVESIHENHQ